MKYISFRTDFVAGKFAVICAAIFSSVEALTEPNPLGVDKKFEAKIADGRTVSLVSLKSERTGKQWKPDGRLVADGKPTRFDGHNTVAVYFFVSPRKDSPPDRIRATRLLDMGPAADRINIYRDVVIDSQEKSGPFALHFFATDIPSSRQTADFAFSIADGPWTEEVVVRPDRSGSIAFQTKDDATTKGSNQMISTNKLRSLSVSSTDVSSVISIVVPAIDGVGVWQVWHDAYHEGKLVRFMKGSRNPEAGFERIETTYGHSLSWFDKIVIRIRKVQFAKFAGVHLKPN